MREADHVDPHGTDLKRGAQIRGVIEGIARLRLGWHQATAIADFSEAARTETVNQKRGEPPFRETARPFRSCRPTPSQPCKTTTAPAGAVPGGR
jgi:hypothetical protein